MIHLDYRSRMVFLNLFFFFVAFVLVTFIVIQGVWFVSLRNQRADLMQSGLDAQMSVEQLYVSSRSILQDDTPQSLDSWFRRSSQDLSEMCQAYSDGSIHLYSKDQKLLTPAKEGLYPENFMREELARASDGVSALSLRNFNSRSYLWYVSPLKIHGEIVGFFSEEVDMGQINVLTHSILIYFVLAGVAGLIILFFIFDHFATQFIQPIKDLTKISKEVDQGNYNVVVQYDYDDEIGDLTAVYNEMTANIKTYINQLEGERERLGSVLASLDDGLIALDEKGNIIASNLLLKTYFGISNPKTIYDFTYQSFLRDIFDRLRDSDAYISEEVECNNRVLHLIGSPIHRDGLEENYMIIIRNITASRQFEREQRKFISSVSHELRTPLTTIIGYTDMLMRRNVEDPTLLTRSLTTINNEGHRLVRLVDDLLSSSRLENLEFTVRKSIIDLENLLNNVVDQMRVKGAQKDIDIRFRSEKDIPVILGDYDRLSQMFINILHNAIKYSEKGGLIDVVITYEDTYVVCAIRDYGTGIDPSQQQLIFSAFYRVEEDRARNEGEGGAGLGLYLVKQIAEKHNGKVHIDSEVGEGTNVTIYLPVPDGDFVNLESVADNEE